MTQNGGQETNIQTYW